MRLSAKQYAQALHETLQSTSPKDQDRVLDNFVTLLADHNDLKMFPMIEEEFHKIELGLKGKTLATVTSAKSLNHETERKLVEELNQLVKGKVELKKKVDESLIGGVVIQMEDTIIDASVKKSLENLRTEIEK